MATKPTHDPATWATDGNAEIEDPGAPKQAIGFVTNEVPPADYFNWLFNNHGAWLEWLRDWHSQYASMDEFLSDSDADDGDVAWIDELGSTAAGTATDHDSTVLDSTAATTVCCDGTYVYWGDAAGVIRSPHRQAGTADRWDALSAHAGNPITALWTNGDLLLVACNNVLYWYNAATKASAGTPYDHGAAINGIVYLDSKAYLACARSANGTVVSVNSSGAVVDSYDHGAGGGHIMYCIATDGEYLFVGGTSAGATNETMFRFEADLSLSGSTGPMVDMSDADVCRGIAVGPGGRVWGCGNYGADDRSVWCIPKWYWNYAIGGVYGGNAQGSYWVAGVAVAGEGGYGLAYDGRLLYVAGLGGSIPLRALDPETGEQVWEAADSATTFWAVYSDGFQLWAARDDKGGGDTAVLQKFNLRTPPCHVKKVAASEPFRTLPQQKGIPLYTGR